MAAEAAGLPDITARMSHDGKVALDWLRQHQGTCSRSLYRLDRGAAELRRISATSCLRPRRSRSRRRPGRRPRWHRRRSRVSMRPWLPARMRSPSSQSPVTPTRARSPHGPDARAAWEADRTGPTGPCEVVEPAAVPPMGPEPATVEPVGDPAAPIVTNEATGPDGSPASDPEPDDCPKDPTNEATAPAGSLALDLEPDVTNEAKNPAEGVARLVPAVPMVVVALLAMVVGSALTAAFGASSPVRDPSRMGRPEARSGGRPTTGNHSPDPPSYPRTGQDERTQAWGPRADERASSRSPEGPCRES